MKIRPQTGIVLVDNNLKLRQIFRDCVCHARGGHCASETINLVNMRVFGCHWRYGRDGSHRREWGHAKAESLKLEVFELQLGLDCAEEAGRHVFRPSFMGVELQRGIGDGLPVIWS